MRGLEPNPLFIGFERKLYQSNSSEQANFAQTHETIGTV
jgi:hypothetical protein